ncbi:hypothetical protein [Zwartia sp.]|uniref:hypothetical protein n=1 Tax=Zwartia sp. TaxID=2978004 RepID=UPI002723FF25|nr:hypothetical protein [Zwartia sp.]MDO9025822.1 hypothetical protein [Zwartia sp.]
MKVILWGGVALLALLWTSGAALMAKAVQWSAKRMTAEPTMSLEAVTSGFVTPVWMTAWFDPTAWVGILETMQDMLGSFESVLPTVGMMMAWLIPAIWITWALGMLILVGLMVIGTLTLKRMQKS